MTHSNSEPMTDGEPRRPPLAASVEPPGWLAVPRGVSLFFGVFCLLNLAGELLHPGFDANIWWIDLRPLPLSLVRGILALCGVLLTIFGVHPTARPALRLATRSALMFLLGGALWNAVTYYRLLAAGAISSSFPIPFSIHVAAALIVILLGTFASVPNRRLPFREMLLVYLTIAVCAAGFPIAQMYCFGKTDYRRSGDVIVVFGCRVYADGTPSEPLRQRVLKAVELYEQGLAERIVMSGGPGDGEIDEPTAMTRLATDHNIPADAITIDARGLNTDATAQNIRSMLEEGNTRRLLAVSDFYHLPRIKLAFRRQGLDVATVPSDLAESPHMWPQLIRETMALWLYYLRPQG